MKPSQGPGQVPVTTKTVGTYDIADYLKIASTASDFPLDANWDGHGLALGYETWYRPRDQQPPPDRFQIVSAHVLGAADHEAFAAWVRDTTQLGREPVEEPRWQPISALEGLAIYTLARLQRSPSPAETALLAQRFSIGFGPASNPFEIEVRWFREGGVLAWTPFWDRNADATSGTFDVVAGDMVEFVRVKAGDPGYPAQEWQQLVNML